MINDIASDYPSLFDAIEAVLPGAAIRKTGFEIGVLPSINNSRLQLFQESDVFHWQLLIHGDCGASGSIRNPRYKVIVRNGLKAMSVNGNSGATIMAMGEFFIIETGVNT